MDMSATPSARPTLAWIFISFERQRDRAKDTTTEALCQNFSLVETRTLLYV